MQKRRIPFIAGFSEEHFAAVGKVVTCWAKLEMLMGDVVWALLCSKNDTFKDIGLSQMGGRQRQDLLRTVVAMTKPESVVHAELKEIMPTIAELGKVREIVAHYGWIPGPKEGEALPFHLKAKGSLKPYRGEAFTARALEIYAERIQGVYDQLLDFLDSFQSRVSP